MGITNSYKLAFLISAYELPAILCVWNAKLQFLSESLQLHGFLVTTAVCSLSQPKRKPLGPPRSPCTYELTSYILHASFHLETASFVLYMLVAFPIFPEPGAAQLLHWD